MIIDSVWEPVRLIDEIVLAVPTKVDRLGAREAAVVLSRQDLDDSPLHVHDVRGELLAPLGLEVLVWPGQLGIDFVDFLAISIGLVGMEGDSLTFVVGDAQENALESVKTL